MKRPIRLGFGLVFSCFGCLVLPLRSAPQLAQMRTFEGTQSGQKQEGNTMPYAYFTSVTITPHGQSFELAGSIDPYHPSGEFFGGEGSMEKDGLVHFRWMDNFDQKGQGTFRFIDHGRSIDFRLVCSYPKRILRYTPKPEYLNICTSPTHYGASLPGEYGQVEAYLDMEPKGPGHVSVDAQIHLYLDTLNRVYIRGMGIWGAEDSLFFNFTDEEHNRGQGQIRFVGSARPVLTVHYPQNATKEQLAKEFNKRQIPLKILENHDR
jgi:hypothetical protein